MRVHRLLASALVAALPFLAPSPAAGETPLAVLLDGLLRGTVFSPDGVFKWTPTDQRSGIVGSLTGTTREFEEKTVWVGADRTVLTAPMMLAAEGSRIRFEIERGTDTKVEIKGDLCIARTHRFSSDTTYMSAVKQVGRTSLFVRGTCEPAPKDRAREEAGLSRLLLSVVNTAKSTADEVDGWIPKEVKVEWTRTTSPDLLVIDDGKVESALVGEAMRIVRDAQGFVRRSLGVSASVVAYPPVLRFTGSRDLFQHLANRKDIADQDAVHVPYTGEVLVSPRSGKLDVRSVARAAARQAYHFAVGVADAEPLASGLSRLAEAVALGAPEGSLLPSDEGRAYELVQAKTVRSWASLLKFGGFERWAKEDPEVRGLEAELAAGYLAGSGGPQAKVSLAGWVAGLKKAAHVEGGALEAFRPVDPTKSDAEYWAYWKKRAEGPKKPGTGPPDPKDKPKGK